MSNDPCRIVFMGSPHFAVPSLELLIETGKDIILVVTQPDRPQGRGRVVSVTPIKQKALELGLPVMQPLSLKDEDFVRHMAELSPNMIIVVALGQIVPKTLLTLPPMGVVNVHPSLLPHFRGSAPIQWAIIKGEKTTGVSTMFLSEKLDAGDVLLSEIVPIREEDTAGSLHDTLALVGARLLVKTIKGLCDRTLTSVAQDHSKATYAPMLKKSDGLVHWSQPAFDICNLIRGLDPWPGAFTFYQGKRLAFFGCTFSDKSPSGQPGEILGLASRGLHMATGQGSVYIREVQLEGRKKLPAADFLRGTVLDPGVVLGI
jgi:methionyl-tRNA formyltransferase